MADGAGSKFTSFKDADTRAILDAELADDHYLGAQTLIVEQQPDNDGGVSNIAGIKIDAPEGSLMDTIDDDVSLAQSIQTGVEQTNARRTAYNETYPDTDGWDLVDQEEIESLVSVVGDPESRIHATVSLSYHEDWTPGTAAVFLPSEPAPNEYHAQYADFEKKTGEEFNDATMQGAGAITSKFAAIHELAHSAQLSVMGSALQYIGDEKQFDAFKMRMEAGADAATVMTVAEINVGEALEIAETKAAMNSMMMDDPAHILAGDALYKAAHQLRTDADGTMARYGGLNMTSTAVEVAQDFVGDGINDRAHSLTNMTDVNKAADYADEVLSGKPAMIPRIQRDGAVILLNADREMRSRLEDGADNALSRNMDKIRAANPEAFRQAEAYIRENYGIDPAKSAPAAEASAPAAPHSSAPTM